MRRSRTSVQIVVLAALVLGLVLVSTSSSAQEVLTNESILTMVRAGLPEGVIVAKIRSSQTRFDLSTDAHGPDEKAVVKIVTERDGQGWVRIRLSAPLAPGEYGFVLGRRIWDFGVD